MAASTLTAKKSENKWIRAFKIPIHAWTLETAKFIEDKCGGFIGIDKDTKLQTHFTGLESAWGTTYKKF